MDSQWLSLCKKWFAVLLVAVVSTVTVAAQGLKVAETQSQTVDKEVVLEAVYGTLTGKIIDKATGLPIQGAKVTINFPSPYPYGNSIEAVTASDGTFILRKIPQGEYKIKISKSGYAAETLPLVQDQKIMIYAGTVTVLADTESETIALYEQSMTQKIIKGTGIAVLISGDNWKSLIMVLIGLIFIYLGIVKDYEPLLLLPIGFGILIGNIPYPGYLPIGVYDLISNTGATQNSVFSLLYYAVTNGIFPPLIFLGIGAMTDFSALISSPKSVLLGAAAQVGIFATFLGALYLGFTDLQAASIGIIGGADGPTSIFVTSMLAPKLLGPVAIAAYSYMGLVPVIQPPFMRLLVSKKEALIRMPPSRRVSKTERVLFPIAVFLVCALVAPGSITLIGMLMLGNILKESGVVDRLAKTASTALIDISVIILGFTVGASTQASVFLRMDSLKIFVLGCISFCVATMGGLLFAKFMNLFLKNKINPLIGAAGVSAVPDSARVVQIYARKFDPNNHILMHAMGPNVAGVIGSALAAGVFIAVLS